MNSCFELSEEVRKLEARVEALTSTMKLAGIHLPPSNSDLIRDCVSTVQASFEGSISLTPEKDEDAIFQEILHVLDVPKDEKMQIDQVETTQPALITNPVDENVTVGISTNQSTPENHVTNTQPIQQPGADNYEKPSSNLIPVPIPCPTEIETLEQTTQDEKLDHEEFFQEIFQFLDEDFLGPEKPTIQPEIPCGRSIIPLGQLRVSPICR